MEKNFFVIINPNAGKKKAQKDWAVLSNLLTNNGFTYEFRFTGGRLDAYNLALDAIANGTRQIIAIGGDGTFNEVVNAIISQKICPSTDIAIGLFGIGTGNDWCRTLNIPCNYSEALDIIKSGKFFMQDAGIAKFDNDGKRTSRYFANVAGMGFDASVAKKVNEDKDSNRTGKILYLKNLFMCLMKSEIVNCEIRIDENKISDEIFSMCVGIGKYNGGGMMQLPNAIADDGLLDITIIKKISKFEVIKQTKNLYDGTFVRHSCVSLFQGKNVEIKSDKIINLELDGEYVGHSPFNFEIIPKAIKVFIP
ncbi:MAG: diacylglycerol kinase family lipid kinase [Ignavibacteriae bacterium]|nr:diacylglycerol kinase family lipid kinase [Ignavibacteriota bacterium]